MFLGVTCFSVHVYLFSAEFSQLCCMFHKGSDQAVLLLLPLVSENFF